MKKVLGIILVCLVVSCSTPEFLVVSKRSNGVLDNCIVGLHPLNRKAHNYSYVQDALVNCNDYEIGDTLYLTRKKFTNF